MRPPDSTTTRELRDASVSDLVSGIVADTGDLLGAHVAAIRNELDEGLRDLRDRTRATIYVAAAMIATAVAVNLAAAASLGALGVPTWLSFWISAALSGLGLVVLRRRGNVAKAGRGPGDPAAALARAGHDAAWLADRASDAIT